MSRLLVIGQSGFLGKTLAKVACKTFCVSGTHNSSDAKATSRFNLFSETDCRSFRFEDHDIIIFAAQVARNARGEPTDPAILRKHFAIVVDRCARRKFVFISSDAVFKGDKGHYTEGDLPEPLTQYGKNVLLCEDIVRTHAVANRDWRIVRCSMLYGRADGQLDRRLELLQRALAQGRPYPCDVDVYRSPVFVEEAAEAIIRITLHDSPGIFHVASERLSLYSFHLRAARALGFNADLAQMRNCPEPAHMVPRDTSLGSRHELLGTRHWTIEDALHSLHRS